MHVSEFEENFLLFSIAYRTCKFLLLFEWHCRKVKKGTVSCLLRYVTFYLMNQEETVLIKVEMELYFVLLKKKKKRRFLQLQPKFEKKDFFFFHIYCPPFGPLGTSVAGHSNSAEEPFYQAVTSPHLNNNPQWLAPRKNC